MPPDLDVPEGWVRMYNPDLTNGRSGETLTENDTAVVTAESFETNHKGKGWKLVNEDSPADAVGDVDAPATRQGKAGATRGGES